MDRMKALHPHIIMAASLAGSMSLKVNTDSTSIAMHFSDLQIVKSGSRSEYFY